MSIEFIRDEFLEGKKEELDNIDKELTKKHKKPNKNVIFLRRFTLALMGQYKPHKKLFDKKHEEINILNRHIIHETKKLHEFKRPIQRLMPHPPLSIPTPHGLNVPMPQQRMQVPTPLKEELKIPKPIQVSNIPQKKEKIKTEERKEVPTPL